jgi:hypothetical protein
LLFGFYFPLAIFLPLLGPVTAVDFSFALQSGVLLLFSKIDLSRSRIHAHNFS